MTKVNVRGESVRTFIVQEIEAHPADIARRTAERFDITRQAANKHLRRLVAEGILATTGQTRNLTYQLCPLSQWSRRYLLQDSPTEDRVWLEDVRPALGPLPDNVLELWHHGFTEMFNNAIDHSEGTAIIVHFERTAARTSMSILDDGVGIFRKITDACGLADERHAVLELVKGKFTTDPSRHSGEGIFFTSRMFDVFSILSGEIYYAHRPDRDGDWILGDTDAPQSGTSVRLELSNHASRTVRKVFDQFTTSGDHGYGFTRTIVPMQLARYGDDNLVSRSQAKRLLTRIDRFRVVILDFAGIETIGQAFADEVFRVFALQHPGVELVPLHAGPAVTQMINRALSHGAASHTAVAPSRIRDE